MSYFYLSALGLVLIAVLFIVFPFLKERKRNNLEVTNANVIKQRIVELSQEVEEGLIDESEKEAAINDLKLALVDESPAESTFDYAESSKVNIRLLLLLALPAIVIGAGVYWHSNQLSGLNEFEQSQIDVISIREKMQNEGGQTLTPNDFAKLALSIRNSLRNKPNDAQGWAYLGLINSSIGRLEEGVAAYERALDLSPQDEELRFKYAETLMMAGTEDTLNNAKRQLAYLISKTPENRNYHLLMTTIAIQLQEPNLALSSFNHIKDMLRPNSSIYLSIVAGLEGLGIQIPNAVTSTSEAESVASKQLNIQVNIHPDLQSKLPANAYMIVFAQQQNGTSRAPLAVKRFILGQLPVQVTLSKSDAMIPSLNLDIAETVKVTARISLDEDVMPSAGEFEGQVENIDVLAVQGQMLTLTISKEL